MANIFCCSGSAPLWPVWRRPCSSCCAMAARTAAKAGRWPPRSPCGWGCRYCCFCAFWAPGNWATYSRPDCLPAATKKRREALSRRCRTRLTSSRPAHTNPATPRRRRASTTPRPVDQVPVPGGALEAEMLVGREMPFLQPQRDHQQHQHAHEHMEAVKAGEHEERRAEHARTEFEVQVGVQVGVFIALHQQESQAQQHGHPHEANRLGTLVGT